MSNSALVPDKGGITEVPPRFGGDTAASFSGSACKSRWERVSRIKVIDPTHLTEARITGHTMVRAGLFSATHAGLSAAHYLEMPGCHSASLLYARARSMRLALRYVTHAHARLVERWCYVETSFHTLPSAGFTCGGTDQRAPFRGRINISYRTNS